MGGFLGFNNIAKALEETLLRGNSGRIAGEAEKAFVKGAPSSAAKTAINISDLGITLPSQNMTSQHASDFIKASLKEKGASLISEGKVQSVMPSDAKSVISNWKADPRATSSVVSPLPGIGGAYSPWSPEISASKAGGSASKSLFKKIPAPLRSAASDILADTSKSGFGHIMKSNMMIGATFGLAGGVASTGASILDPSTFQTNGIIKPMLQGAFKGALLGAAHAGGSIMTRATSGSEHAWISNIGRMTENVAKSNVTKGALAAVAFADAGNINFTKARNPVK